MVSSGKIIPQQDSAGKKNWHDLEIAKKEIIPQQDSAGKKNFELYTVSPQPITIMQIGV